MPQPKLLMIVGLDHSGTTILDAALGCAPQITGIGEGLRVLDASARGGIVRRLRGRGTDEVVCTCGSSAARCPVWSHFPPDVLASTDLVTGVPRLMEAVTAQAPETRFVLDSSPNGLHYIDQLKAFDIRVIQITRDVRSWVASKRKRTGRNLVASYLIWSRQTAQLDKLIRRHAIPRFCLGYEEFALRPKETLTALCEWIGVPFDPTMLAPYENTGSHIVLGNGAIRKPDLAASIRYDGAWMAQHDYPVMSGLLYGFCARANRRLVYSNAILRRRA